MPVILTVDARSGVPIYQQIVEQVKRSTALGVLLPGEQLPTVKQLALNLTINPNTVARAYRGSRRREKSDRRRRARGEGDGSIARRGR
jgi:GntR family transcriptional regulator